MRHKHVSLRESLVFVLSSLYFQHALTPQGHVLCCTGEADVIKYCSDFSYEWLAEKNISVYMTNAKKKKSFFFNVCKLLMNTFLFVF